MKRWIGSTSSKVLVLCLMPALALADQGRWSSSGPYGGEVFALEINPVTPTTMYALTKGGLFKTVDGGVNWLRAEHGLIGSAASYLPMLMDRDEPDTLYVFDSDNRMYVSRDGAENWRWNGIWVDRDDNGNAIYPSDLADVPGNAGDFYLAVHRENPLLTSGFALLVRFNGYGLFGQAPVFDPPGLPLDRSVDSVAVNPANANQILVGMGGYLPTDVTPPFTDPIVYFSNDGGQSFSPVLDNTGFVSFNATTALTVAVSDLQFGPAGRAFALLNDTNSANANTYQVLYVNDSSGGVGAWKRSDGQVRRDPAQNCFTWPRALMTKPGDGDTVYAGTMAGVMRFTLGSFASEPVPANGVLLNIGLTANPTPPSPLAPLPVPPCDIEATPDFPLPGSAFYAATLGGGLMRTTDPAFTLFAPHLNNRGLAGTHIRGLAVDPTAPGALLSAIGDSFWGSNGIYRSNAGVWNTSNVGFGGAQSRQIAIDPTTTAASASMRVYAVGRAPLTVTGTLGDLNYRNFGIYGSSNGGQNWSNLDGNLPLTAPATGTPLKDLGIVRKLIIDPRSCGPQAGWQPTGPICAGGSGPLQRLFVVADGRVIDVDDAMADTRTRYRTHRILRSDDAGATWVDLSANPGFPPSIVSVRKLTAPFTVYYNAVLTPTLIVMDPKDSRRLWVGTLYNPVDQFAGGGPDPGDIVTGAYYSDDAGATWQARANGLPLRDGYVNARQDVLAMAVDPDPNRVGADPALWLSQTTSGGNSAITATIWKSTDAGLNWALSDQGVHDVADIRAIEVDPLNSDVLYASGSGSESNPASVFRSRDGGASWKSISVGLPTDGGATIAIDPVPVTITNIDGTHTESATVNVGTAAGVWSVTNAPDYDDDGISDADEGGLGPPEGTTGRDTNGDGIDDARQRDVGGIGVSIRGPSGSTAPSRTTDVQRSVSLPVGPTSCLQAVDVQDFQSFQFGRDFTANEPHEFSYPHNLRRIEVLDCTHAVIDFIYAGSDFGREYGWSFRYRGPGIPGDDESIDWHAYSAKSVLLPPQPYDPTHQTTWRVTVDANTFGSYRPLTDRVLFLGGPACYDDRIFRNSLETTPDTGPTSCNVN
jgi:hypothetical protein